MTSHVSNSYQSSGDAQTQKTFLKIKDQPASVRFRYDTEKSPSIITGKGGGCPSVQMENHSGSFVIVVSLVTADDTHKQHPFMLKGPNCEEKAGYFRIKVSERESRLVRLTELNLIQTSESDYGKVLEERKKKGIDPSKASFGHLNDAESHLDKHAVCLAIQAFRKREKTGIYDVAVSPVYSEPIRNKKSELKITTLSHTASPCSGGQRMVVLTSKITRDVQVRFFKERDTRVIWEAKGDVEMRHSGSAIVLKTPKFHTEECILNAGKPRTKVKIELCKKNDPSETSEPYEFSYHWLTPDADVAMYSMMNRGKRGPEGQPGYSEPPRKKYRPPEEGSADCDHLPTIIPSNSDSGGYSRTCSAQSAAESRNHSNTIERMQWVQPTDHPSHHGSSQYQKDDIRGTADLSEQQLVSLDKTQNSLEKLLLTLPDIHISSSENDESGLRPLMTLAPSTNQAQVDPQPVNEAQQNISDNLPGSPRGFSFLSTGSNRSHSLSNIQTECLIGGCMDTSHHDEHVNDDL